MKFSSVFIAQSARLHRPRISLITASELSLPSQNLFAAPHRPKPYTGVSIRNIVSLHSPSVVVVVVVVERVVFPFYRVPRVSPVFFPPIVIRGQTLSKKLCDDANQLVGRIQIIGRIVPRSSLLRKHRYHFLESCRSMQCLQKCSADPTIETSLSSDLFLPPLKRQTRRKHIFSSYPGFISYWYLLVAEAHSVEFSANVCQRQTSRIYIPRCCRASLSKWGNWFGPRGFSPLLETEKETATRSWKPPVTRRDRRTRV